MSLTCSGNKLMIGLEDSTDEIISSIRTAVRGDGKKRIAQVTVEYGGGVELASWKEHVTSVFEALVGGLNCVACIEQFSIHLGDLTVDQELPVTVLTRLLDTFQELSVLCLESVRLIGQPHEFAALVKATRRHSSLTFVCMSMVSASSQQNSTDAANADPEESRALEPFIMALADLTTLQILELDDVPISRLALQQICLSKTILTLELWNIPMTEQCISFVKSSLSQNNVLKSLELCCCQLEESAGLDLLDMLARDYSCQHLESVVLEIEWGSTTMFGIPVGKLLKYNQTLKSLHMICVQQETQTVDSNMLSTLKNSKTSVDCSAEAYGKVICHALAQNQTLERLTLEFQQSRHYRNDKSRLGQGFSKPLQETLEEHNHTLQYFNLTGGCCTRSVAWNEEIQFLLHLNQAGRRAWAPGACCRSNDHDKGDAFYKLLQHLLPRHQDNQQEHQHQHKYYVSTLFYLLSMQPHLIRC